MALLPLGLVVDLTNTARYYDPNEFIEGGVEYVKLEVVGKMVPNNTIVRRFMQIVDEYYRRRESQGKYVGVHCTHGLNRTGYLVCAYLIQRLHYRANDAIELFNARRGHVMERPAYLENLFKMEGANREDSNRPQHHHPQQPELMNRQPHWQRPSSSFQRDRDWRDDSDSRSSRQSSSGHRQPHWRNNPPPRISRPFHQRPPNGEQVLSWRQREPEDHNRTASGKNSEYRSASQQQRTHPYSWRRRDDRSERRDDDILFEAQN